MVETISYKNNTLFGFFNYVSLYQHRQVIFDLKNFILDSDEFLFCLWILFE